MKVVLVLAFIAIFASLASALFFMLRGNRDRDAEGSGKRMAWALTVRIGVSIFAFLCILVAWTLGYIQPHGIPLGQ